jgi:molybdopterin-dependent oxidoreductase alpha subunit
MSDATSEDPTNPTLCFESYRSKEAVGPTEAGRSEATALLDAANDALSHRAQNPAEIAGTRVGRAYTTAAGIPAILKTFQFGLAEMGPLRTAETFHQINQRDGFDCQSCAWGNPDRRKFFEFCENGAKALSDEATKKRITREFFAEHSVLELAEKSDYWLNRQGRLTEPMVLRRGSNHYEPITWDAAFQLVADELKALSSPDEAAFYTSGKTTNEPAFLFQLFARQFGTNNLPDCSNMCHESSGTGLSQTLGIGKGSVTIDDFEKCDLIIIFGNNPGTNHPRMLTSLQAAKAQGAKIIAVNPLPETGLMRVTNPNPQDYKNPLELPFALLGHGTALADLYLPVRINGDVALIKGLMKFMLEEDAAGRGGGVDHAFIEEYTAGFAPLVDDVRATTWEEIVAGSGLTKEEIEAAARMCVASKRMICAWAMGLTQQKNGVDNVAAVVNLLLLGGHMGRPGAGTCCVRGHSNVQGDRTMGVWERPPKAFLDALGREFNFVPPAKWGKDTVETMHAMCQGQIKVFFAISGNFVSNTPDTVYSAHAMQECRLTVHVSTKLNRSHIVTGQQALILPCIGRSERDVQDGGEQFVTVEDAMGEIGTSQGRLAPASPDLRSDVAIIAGIAHATLGESPVPWKKLAGNYDLIRDAISRVVRGFENFNQRIRSEKTFYLPNGTRSRRFETASGKAQFSVTPIPKHDLGPGEYLMMTIRTHDQFNSTIYGLDDRYRGVYGGRRVIFLNVDDMKEAGLHAGQLVDIRSHFEDEIRIAPSFLVVPYLISRHCAATYYPETNVLVPVRSVADKSNQPVSKCIRITLQPSRAADPRDVDISLAAITYNLKRKTPEQVTTT